jgi:hypothetical protein
MRRTAIGLAVGMAVWVGSAVAAEAQVIITPNGPLAVNAGDPSTTFTADVTSPGPYTLAVNIWTQQVDLNGAPLWNSDGTPVLGTLLQICLPVRYSNYGTNVPITDPISFTFTPQAGTYLVFWSKVTLCSNPTKKDIKMWTNGSAGLKVGGS